jgi:hypothetical protein
MRVRVKTSLTMQNLPTVLCISPSAVTSVTGSPLNSATSVSGEDALALHVWLHTEMLARRFDTSETIRILMKMTCDSAERNRLMWLLSNHSPANGKSFHESLQAYESAC